MDTHISRKAKKIMLFCLAAIVLFICAYLLVSNHFPMSIPKNARIYEDLIGNYDHEYDFEIIGFKREGYQIIDTHYGKEACFIYGDLLVSKDNHNYKLRFTVEYLVDDNYSAQFRDGYIMTNVLVPIK